MTLILDPKNDPILPPKLRPIQTARKRTFWSSRSTARKRTFLGAHFRPTFRPIKSTPKFPIYKHDKKTT